MKSAEKIARLCGYCYQGTQNYLSLMSREITLKKTLSQKTQVQQDTIDEIDSFNEDSIEEELTKVNSSGDFEERRKILFEKISAIIDLMSCKITCLMDLEVKSQLIKILVNALHLVHLDNINRKDFMDICHYIKIKRIKANGSVIPRLEYIQGIICTKNVSDRKMKNCFERPKILIISSSIDLTNLNEKKENDVPVNMEVLLQNERKIMRKTVENILKFSPDVIFVGNSVNRIASEILKSQGVTLFVKVKTHLLRRIARMTRTKIIKSLKNIHKLTDRSITGICEKLYTKKILYEDNSKDPTLLYLEGCNSENGGTIAISGSSLEELTSIKKAIKILLRLGRHIVLEHEVVFIEKQMREELKNTYIAEELSCSLVEQLPLKRFEENNEKEALDIWNNDFKEGDFSNFLDRKMGISRFLKKDYIHYTKIHIVRALIENYTDISGNPAALLELNSKKYDVNESFSELCGLPSVNKIYYYSEDDITLGAFILNKIKNLFTRCEREGCNRPRNKHMALYYQGNRFVKISVEITGFIKAAALNSDGKYVYFEENKASENVRKSFSNSGKFDSLKPEPLLTSFRTFFACERCGMKLTEDKNLERPYLEYSFTRFLSHFFVGNEKKRNWKNEKILLNNDEVKCPHDTRKRVFQYGEFLINFSSGNLKPNSLEFIKFNTKQNLKNIQEASDQILNKKRELYLKKFKEIIINFINALKESIQKLDNNKISVFHEEFDIKSKDKIKSALETLLQKIQFFALSIETTLNSTLSNYLDLEFKRIKLAGQLSNFLEVFYQFIIKRPDTTAKIVSFNLLITNLSGEKNEQFLINTNKNIAPANQTQKEEENLPKIRPNSFFKRCLSSDKVSPREDEKLKTSTYIKKLSDVRFSSKPKPRPKQLVQNEKLGFFKKPSMQLRFNEKIDNIEDSFSENELENITETDDKPFKFEEIQLNLESSPMEEHDLEGISPPIQEKASEIPIKKLRSNNLEVIFKDLKSLNTGLDLSYFSVVTNEFAGILKFQKYVSDNSKYIFLLNFNQRDISQYTRMSQ